MSHHTPRIAPHYVCCSYEMLLIVQLNRPLRRSSVTVGTLSNFLRYVVTFPSELRQDVDIKYICVVLYQIHLFFVLYCMKYYTHLY